MNKMMHAKEQDRKRLSATIDQWFDQHFADITPDHPLHARLQTAKADARTRFGLATLTKGDHT